MGLSSGKLDQLNITELFECFECGLHGYYSSSKFLVLLLVIIVLEG